MTTQPQMQDGLAAPQVDRSRPLPHPWTEITALESFSPSEPAPPSRAPRGLSRRALNRARSYIAENLGERFTLDDLARQAGVSRFHFARLFRISTGDSPMAYLLKSRIERAKQMLLLEERPVSEIAAALGFCDQSHLTRTFRRMTGLTPREFARLHSEVD